MARIEIMDGATVVNTIIADEATAEQLHPGAWRLAEQQPEPAVPSAPQSCTPAQGLVALYAVKGITEDDLHAAIALIEDPALRYTARVGLARATEWRRESPTMQQLAQLLGLSEADLDALYAYAVTVNV